MKVTGSTALADSSDEKELSALMRLAQDGDAEAYRRLLSRIKAMMESYVKNSLLRLGRAAPALADDLTQEILLGLHAKRNTYDPKQFFLPWLYAIARYKVIDFIRDTKKRSVHVPLEAEHLEVAHAEFVSDSAFSSVDTHTLIAMLPQKQKDVLMMVKLDGLSVSEASLKTGFSESDIKVTVHRALKTLRKKLKGSLENE